MLNDDKKDNKNEYFYVKLIEMAENFINSI